MYINREFNRNVAHRTLISTHLQFILILYIKCPFYAIYSIVRSNSDFLFSSRNEFWFNGVKLLDMCLHLYWHLSIFKDFLSSFFFKFLFWFLIFRISKSMRRNRGTENGHYWTSFRRNHITTLSLLCKIITHLNYTDIFSHFSASSSASTISSISSFCTRNRGRCQIYKIGTKYKEKNRMKLGMTFFYFSSRNIFLLW